MMLKTKHAAYIQSIRKKYLVHLRYRLEWKKKYVLNIRRKVHQCIKCEKSFIKKTIVENHLKICSSQKKNDFKCVFCGYLFESYLSLVDHSKKHADEQPYQCAHCNKSFVFLSLLTEHEKVHIPNANTHLCLTCGKNFGRRSSLKKHLEVHRKKHACCHCGNLFSHKGLRNHDKINKALSISTSCNVCGGGIKCVCVYVKHLTDHSLWDGNVEGESSDQLYELVSTMPIRLLYCLLCGTICEDKVSLFKHVEVHLEAEVVDTSHYVDNQLAARNGTQKSIYQHENDARVPYTPFVTNEGKLRDFIIDSYSEETYEGDDSLYNPSSVTACTSGISEIEHSIIAKVNGSNMNNIFSEPYLEILPHSIFSSVIENCNSAGSKLSEKQTKRKRPSRASLLKGQTTKVDESILKLSDGGLPSVSSDNLLVNDNSLENIFIKRPKNDLKVDLPDEKVLSNETNRNILASSRVTPLVRNLRLVNNQPSEIELHSSVDSPRVSDMKQPFDYNRSDTVELCQLEDKNYRATSAVKSQNDSLLEIDRICNDDRSETITGVESADLKTLTPRSLRKYTSHDSIAENSHSGISTKQISETPEKNEVPIMKVTSATLKKEKYKNKKSNCCSPNRYKCKYCDCGLTYRGRRHNHLKCPAYGIGSTAEEENVAPALRLGSLGDSYRNVDTSVKTSSKNLKKDSVDIGTEIKTWKNMSDKSTRKDLSLEKTASGNLTEESSQVSKKTEVPHFKCAMSRKKKRFKKRLRLNMNYQQRKCLDCGAMYRSRKDYHNLICKGRVERNSSTENKTLKYTDDSTSKDLPVERTFSGNLSNELSQVYKKTEAPLLENKGARVFKRRSGLQKTLYLYAKRNKQSKCTDCGILYSGRSDYHYKKCQGREEKKSLTDDVELTLPLRSNSSESKLEVESQVMMPTRKSVRKRIAVSFVDFVSSNVVRKSSKMENSVGVESHVKKNIKVNKRLDKDEQPYCPLCGKIFLYRDTFEVHKQLHEKAGWFVCYTCGNIYRNKNNLERHCRSNHASAVSGREAEHQVQVSHAEVGDSGCRNKVSDIPISGSWNKASDVPITGKEYSCMVCGAQIIGKGQFWKHICVHITESSTCPFCARKFQEPQNVRKHVKVNHQSEFSSTSYKCSVCDKGLRSKDEYKEHLQMHRDAGWMICTVCGRSFLTFRSLSMHMRAHGKQNPTCTFCGKVFRTVRSLHCHKISSHKENKVTACSLCQKTFYSISSLKYHKTVFHKSSKISTEDSVNVKIMADEAGRERSLDGGMAEVIADKPANGKCDEKVSSHHCFLCNKSFHSKDLFSKHIQKHVDDGEIICTTCGKVFKYYRALRSHEVFTHIKGKKRIPCPMCGKICKSLTALKIHQKMLHENRAFRKYKKVDDNKSYKPLEESNNDRPSTRDKYKREKAVNHGKSCSGDMQEMTKNSKSLNGRLKKNIAKGSDVNVLDPVPGGAPEAKLYRCPACRQTFASRDIFSVHVLRHEKSKWYICVDCSLCFWMKEGLRDHCLTEHSENWVGDEINITVERPTITIDVPSIIKIEKESTANSVCSSTEKMDCTVCGKKKMDMKTFEVHVHMHEKYGWFICKYCGNCYKDKNNLFLHKEKYHNKNEFAKIPLVSNIKVELPVCSEVKVNVERMSPCDKCGQFYGTSKDDYEKHIAVHERLDQMPFVCTVCKRSFSNESELLSHKKVHKLLVKCVKKLQCIKCGAIFVLKDLYEAHTKWCDGKRNASLKRSQVRYGSDSLLSHASGRKALTDVPHRSVSFKQKITSKPLRKLKCSYCDMETYFDVTLNSHLLKHHIYDSFGSHSDNPLNNTESTEDRKGNISNENLLRETVNIAKVEDLIIKKCPEDSSTLASDSKVQNMILKKPQDINSLEGNLALEKHASEGSNEISIFENIKETGKNARVVEVETSLGKCASNRTSNVEIAEGQTCLETRSQDKFGTLVSREFKNGKEKMKINSKKENLDLSKYLSVNVFQSSLIDASTSHSEVDVMHSSFGTKTKTAQNMQVASDFSNSLYLKNECKDYSLKKNSNSEDNSLKEEIGFNSISAKMSLEKTRSEGNILGSTVLDTETEVQTVVVKKDEDGYIVPLPSETSGETNAPSEMPSEISSETSVMDLQKRGVLFLWKYIGKIGNSGAR